MGKEQKKQNWRRSKEIETRRKLVDKRLDRGIGMKEEEEKKELYEKYRVQKKGLKTVIEELKQRMLAKSEIVKI